MCIQSTCDRVSDNMPFHCSVPKCRGNYIGGPKVSMFKFPKDEKMRMKWLASIGRTNFALSHSSRVCHLHFEKDDVLWETQSCDERTGQVLRVALKVPRLKPNAVPLLFPKCPADAPKEEIRYGVPGIQNLMLGNLAPSLQYTSHPQSTFSLIFLGQFVVPTKDKESPCTLRDKVIHTVCLSDHNYARPNCSDSKKNCEAVTDCNSKTPDQSSWTAGRHPAVPSCKPAVGNSSNDSGAGTSRSCTHQVGRPAAPRVGEPASPRVGEPASPRVGGPASPRVGEPASLQVGEPASLRVGEPASLLVGGPAAPRIGEPATLQVGEPASLRVGRPLAPRVGGPPPSRISGPPPPRVGGPAAPRVGGPPPLHVRGPVALRVGEPAVPWTVGPPVPSPPPLPHRRPSYSQYHCAVYRCATNVRKMPGIVCHSFPKDQHLRREWLARCGRADVVTLKNARVCSVHFQPEDYERDLRNELLGLPLRKKLLPTAVPSLNLPSQDGDGLAECGDLCEKTGIFKRKTVSLIEDYVQRRLQTGPDSPVKTRGRPRKILRGRPRRKVPKRDDDDDESANMDAVVQQLIQNPPDVIIKEETIVKEEIESGPDAVDAGTQQEFEYVSVKEEPMEEPEESTSPATEEPCEQMGHDQELPLIIKEEIDCDDYIDPFRVSEEGCWQ